MPMSISEVRSICLTIDAMSCGILGSVYIARGSPQPLGQPRPTLVRPSGTELGEAAILGEARAGDRAQPLPSARVAVENRDPAEELELLRREASPAPIEIQLREKQVNVGVSRGDRDREVAGVHGRDESTGPTMRAGSREEAFTR